MQGFFCANKNLKQKAILTIFGLMLYNLQDIYKGANYEKSKQKFSSYYFCK